MIVIPTFSDLRALLDALGQSYTVNFRLVRGIDYYTKTVFEVWAEGIGAQAALCGGGRYDGLAEAIGGPPTPGVGFGSGIERIVLGLQQMGIEPPGRRRARGSRSPTLVVRRRKRPWV